MRAAEQRVSFEEMRRLMRVYGSLKCLRNRKPQSGRDDAKASSVRRKFYRWFPDFDERFERVVATGKGGTPYFRPRFGHEFEMRYRAERRREDGELLAQKRAMCRRGKQHDASSEKDFTFSSVPPPVKGLSPGVESVNALNDHVAACSANTESAFAASSRSTSVIASSVASTNSRPSVIERRVTPPMSTGSEYEDGLLEDNLSLDGLLDDGIDIMTGVFDEDECSFFGADGGFDYSVTSDRSPFDLSPQNTVAEVQQAPNRSRADTNDRTSLSFNMAGMEGLNRTVSLPMAEVPGELRSDSFISCEEASWAQYSEGDDPFGNPIEDTIEGHMSMLDDVESQIASDMVS